MNEVTHIFLLYGPSERILNICDTGFNMVNVVEKVELYFTFKLLTLR